MVHYPSLLPPSPVSGRTSSVPQFPTRTENLLGPPSNSILSTQCPRRPVVSRDPTSVSHHRRPLSLDTESNLIKSTFPETLEEKRVPSFIFELFPLLSRNSPSIGYRPWSGLGTGKVKSLKKIFVNLTRHSLDIISCIKFHLSYAKLYPSVTFREWCQFYYSSR